jgi:SulP family sulfate permease
MTSLPAKSLPAMTAQNASSFNWRNIKRGFAREDFLPSLPTALVTCFLSIIFCVSMAALIFRGPLAPYFSLGVSMTLVTTVTVGIVTAFTSSIPGVIATPDNRTAPLLAILAASVAAGFAPNDPLMVTTCLSALLIATALNGVVLSLLGYFRMGILVRFLPYPVVGGFIAGAGWLLVKGGLTVATGFEYNLDTFRDLFVPATLLRWAPSLAIAFVILVVNRRKTRFPVIPSIIAFSVVLFYIITWLAGLTVPQLREMGWLPAPFPNTIAWHPLSLALLHTTVWSNLASHIAAFATICMVSAISTMMVSSSLEVSSKLEVDADRELQSAGVGNFASFLSGGLIGFHSLSLTSLSLRIGPNSRWVGLFTVIGTALTLFLVPDLISYLPVPVISTLLLYLGLNFLTQWLIDAYFKMRRTDYLVIVLIVVVVAWAGYIIGVGVGLVTALTLFALRYSLIDVVRLEFNGAQHRSNVDRTPAELAVLRPLRVSTHILKLQGFIFFGTAYSLLQRVRDRAHCLERDKLRYLILDFRHVTGIDSSALLSLSKLLHIGEEADFTTICTGVPAGVMHTLQRETAVGDGYRFHPDIDHAVEWCEARELADLHAEGEPEVMGLEAALVKAVPGRPEVAPHLARFFRQEDFPAGHVLTVQGEISRDLFLVGKGRVSVLLKAHNGEIIRLRTLGPGSIVGEIGMYLGRPRTASIVTETESIVWRLPAESLASMEREDPRCAAALHEILARMLASRLTQANELLEISLR